MERQDLYGLPLTEFTEQRNALAKELRQQGQREEAAAVAKLRKPSVAAWSVNQLVRTQRRDIDALLEAGDTLRRTQAELVAKRGDPSTLRQAVEAERAAVDQLLGKARGLLDADGHELTAPRLAQVAETLHAAALDDEARASVRDGCLERELRHVGIGSPEGLGAGARPSRTPRRGSGSGSAGTPRARNASPRQEQAGRRKQERASGQERAARERAGREAEATARRRLERATRRLRTAERRYERAAAELRDAEAALATARETAAQAEHELQQAKRALDDL